MLDAAIARAGLTVTPEELEEHRILNVANTSGLTNLLVNSDVTLDQAVHRTAYERVWLVPSGPIPANPSSCSGRTA